MGLDRTGEELASQLEGARSVIESHFLSAGEILTRSAEGVGALIASLETLTKALDENTVSTATKDMRMAADVLVGLSENHATRQSTIMRLGELRSNLAKHVTDMRSSLAYMRAFTVNIKIVSSGIAQAGSTFESFAQEISDCIESGRDQLREVEEEIINLQDGLTVAGREGQRLASQLSHLLPSLPNALSECAAMMAQHYRRVHVLAGEVAGIARNTQKCVVRVLQALQIGDMTRQRIEHVQAGLKDVAKYSDPKLVSLVFALLDRQLEKARLIFDSEVAEIERAMSDMTSHSRDLLKLRDIAYSDDGNSGGDSLNSLLERIEVALVLVGEIEGANSLALKTGQEMASAAEHLNTRISAIQSLKNDVQYMALNTTIKCAQIGEAARPLSVIAVELRDHGQHLEGAAANGLWEIGNLNAAAADLASAGGDSGELTGTDALGIAARLIRDVHQSMERETAILVSKGEEVLEVLSQSVECLSFRDEIGATLETVAETLSDLAAATPEDAQSITDDLAKILTAIHSRYTMKQERDIHQEFIGWLGVDLAPPEVRAPAVA